MPRLDAARAEQMLATLAGWEIVAGRLRRVYRFPDFARALAFVNRVGALAEAANHHPDIKLSWGKVELELVTHSDGGLSAKDFALAADIDR